MNAISLTQRARRKDGRTGTFCMKHYFYIFAFSIFMSDLDFKLAFNSSARVILD